MKKTHKSNGSKCTKTEYSEIEIFKHFLKSYTYIIWKNKSVLDFATEDDIMSLLDEKQLLDFYHFDKTSFKVSVEKIEKHMRRND